MLAVSARKVFGHCEQLEMRIGCITRGRLGLRLFFMLLGVLLLASSILGCSQSEGSLEVDVGQAPGAVSYQVDLFADEQGLPLIDRQMASADGLTTFLKVEAGKWSILVQALDENSNTVAHCISKVQISSGSTLHFKAEDYQLGLPGFGGSTGPGITLDGFGPSGVALLSLLHFPQADNAPAVKTSVKVGSGASDESASPLGQTPSPLAQYASGFVYGCATDLARNSRGARDNGSLAIAPQANLQLGQSTVFGDVQPGESTKFFFVTSFKSADCVRLLNDSQTEHCLIFAEVKDGAPVLSESRALQIAQAFDSNNPFIGESQGVYEDTRARFGSEWATNPVGGRDGDERVVLVFASPDTIGGAALFGFFWPDDEAGKTVSSNSNEGEILYLNAERAQGELYDIIDTIAHEFTHLVLWNQKVGRDGTFPPGASQENVTLDEGLAVLNEDLSGFSYTGNQGGNFFLLSAVQATLSEGLNRPFFKFRQILGDYGAGYLFWRYIHDRFGEEKLRAIMTAPGTGRENIAAVLEVPFVTLFAQFGQAVALNGAASLPPELSFSGLNLNTTYTDRSGASYALDGIKNIRSTALPGNLQDLVELEPWGMNFYWATGGNGSSLYLSLGSSSSILSGIYDLVSQQSIWGKLD